MVVGMEEDCLVFMPKENAGLECLVGSCIMRPHVPGKAYLAGPGPRSVHAGRGVLDFSTSSLIVCSITNGCC